MKFKAKILSLILLSNLVFAEEIINTGNIDVYSISPLPGLGIDRTILPSSVEEINIESLKEQIGVSIADYLINNAKGVTVNEATGNPWQQEIRYRGYTAGSTAGNEQGLSVYVDGVRENQPFSDVVLWDTLPSFAYSGVQMVPGSNPIYGLNTLGGAIAFQTKSGATFQGTNAEFTGGSWGRQISLIEHGSSSGAHDFYIGYQYTTEEGWRDHSPNHLNQFFSKGGWEDETTRFELSLTVADNNLIGNGLAPKYLLGSDNTGINTVPDYTGNIYNKINLSASHFLDDETLLTTNAYWKRSDRNTWNGDAEIELDADNLAIVSGGAVSIDGNAITLFNYTDDEIDEMEGENRLTNTKQDKFGVAAQLAFTEEFNGHENNLTIGVTAETSLVSFVQSEFEGATLNSDRSLVKGTGEEEENTNLQGRTKTFGLYAVDTFSYNKNWHITGGARYNYQEIDNLDRRADQSEGSLTEIQSWGRINPTFGITYKDDQQFSTYASYGESNRAPTSIEVGCSNPKIACTLPTQMADDPPLDDVVAKTWEWGFRNQTKNLDISGAIFRAVNHDDLQFVNTNAQNGLGYFKNIGQTIRQGLDLNIGGKGLFGIEGTEKFSWSGTYGYMHATYNSDLALVSDANDSRVTTANSFGGFDDDDLFSGDALTELGESIRDLLSGNSDSDLATLSTSLNSASSKDDVEEALETLEDAGKNIGTQNSIINVKKGDYLANIPKHSYKFRLNYKPLPNLRMGSSLIAFSESYMMGNENNEHGGTNGDGKVPAYAIVNMDADYKITEKLSVSLKAINVFDKTYYTGGRLLMNGFTGEGNTARSEVFRGEGLAPGSPQAGWLSINYKF